MPIATDPREQESDDDPRRINCDILVVSRAKEGKMYALAIANKKGKRIAPVPLEAMTGLSVGDTPVDKLDPGNHDLIPNWRVYAEFNDGWHIDHIETGVNGVRE